MSKSNRSARYTNQHASIVTQPNSSAQIGGFTSTRGREDDLEAFIHTDSKNATRLDLYLGQFGVSLSGRQVRTLQRLLNKHYSTCGFPSFPGAE